MSSGEKPGPSKQGKPWWRNKKQDSTSEVVPTSSKLKRVRNDIPTRQSRLDIPKQIFQLGKVPCVLPMSFSVSLFGVASILVDWFIPIFSKAAGTEFASWISTNRVFFIKMFLYMCEGKLYYACTRGELLPQGLETPDLTLDRVDKLRRCCFGIPKVLSNILKHIGAVTVHEQRWFPDSSCTGADILSRLIPRAMTEAGLIASRAFRIDDEVVRILNSIMPASVTHGRITDLGIQTLKVSEISQQDVQLWCSGIRTLGELDGLVASDILSGEGDVGQLLCNDNYVRPKVIQQAFCQVNIPEAALSDGVAFGVGYVKDATCRNYGLGREFAVIQCDSYQDGIRSNMFRY